MSEFFEFYSNGHFTDLTLELYDQTTYIDKPIEIHVHKIIISAKCLFFKTMLLSNFAEASSSVIKCTVPDAKITSDIIVGFYGGTEINQTNYPSWKYILLKQFCLHFLGLPIEINMVKNLSIPTEGFELLLDVIDMIGYDDFMVQKILDNLPLEYDMTSFPQDLIEQMVKLDKYYHAVCFDRIVSFIDIKKKEIYKKIKLDDYYVAYKLSPNEIYLACLDYNSSTKINELDIYELQTGTWQYTIKELNYKISHFCYSRDSQYIVVALEPLNQSNTITKIPCKIMFFDLTTGKKSIEYIEDTEPEHIEHIEHIKHIEHTKHIEVNDQISYIDCSPNNDLIVVGDYSGKVSIIDMVSGNIIKTITEFNTKICHAFYSPNQKYLLYGTNKDINVLDLETNTIIINMRIISIFSRKITTIEFSHDNQYIIYSIGSYIYIRNIISNKIREIDNTTHVDSLHITPDNKYIMSVNGNNKINIWNMYVINNCVLIKRNIDGETFYRVTKYHLESIHSKSFGKTLAFVTDYQHPLIKKWIQSQKN